jgi:hypothetical protein
MDEDRDSSDAALDAKGHFDLILSAVNDLFAVDGDVLPAVGRQQVRQQPVKCGPLLIEFRRRGRFR